MRCYGFNKITIETQLDFMNLKILIRYYVFHHSIEIHTSLINSYESCFIQMSFREIIIRRLKGGARADDKVIMMMMMIMLVIMMMMMIIMMMMMAIMINTIRWIRMA